MEGWLFESTETAESYLEGAAAGAFSAVDFVEVFFAFLDFLVLAVDLSVDFSSDANVPKLMVRAIMATMIKDSNFFMGLSPCNCSAARGFLLAGFGMESLILHEHTISKGTAKDTHAGTSQISLLI